jgi:endonuclease G
MSCFIHFILAIWICFPSLIFAQNTAEQLTVKQKELAALKLKLHSLEDEIEALKLQEIRNALRIIGYPKGQPHLEIVEHSAMAIGFDNNYKMAAWVMHQLLPDVSFGSHGRSNDFRPDPKLSQGSAVEADYFIKIPQPDGTFKYKGFGFDRGHLAPSADFRWSAKALSESYFYSNMTPQRPGFNRESWAEVEDLLRSIVDNENKSFYVITGPILSPDLPHVPESVNKLKIPELHYKIIIDTSDENPRGMAFLMPNKKCDYPPASYVVRTDSVEQLTGLDFFPNLSAQKEKLIEGHSKFSAWKTGKSEIEAKPIPPDQLPKGVFNTVQARYHDGNRITVVGKVVSTKLSAKGHTFLNLDRVFPNQIFTITIWKDARNNFSYKPEEYLNTKYIMVTGQIKVGKDGKPSLNVTNEKQIRSWEADEEY